MAAQRLRITGLVQGVFYRAHSQEKAVELGLTGWVRNLPDGSVEIHAEGTPEQLKKLEEWCWEGPPSADVKSVTVEDAQDEHCTTFTIS